MNYALPFDPERISPDRTLIINRHNYFLNVQMLEDRDGAFWLSAPGNVYRMKDGAVTTYAAKDGLPPSLVRDILQDRQGDIWIATQGDGVCRLNAGRFACYNTTNGLSSNDVREIFEDREGTLWVGTNERGLNRLTRQVVTPLSLAHGLADKNVYPLLEARDGSFWIGSFSALSQYKDGKIKNYTRRDGLRYEIVQALHEDRDGRLWVGSIGGVEYYDDGKFTDFTERLGLRIGDIDFWSIQQDRHGALWFGTNKGLIQYQEDGAVTRYTTENGLPSNVVKAIFEARDGSLYVGTDGGLVFFRRDASVSFSHPPLLFLPKPTVWPAIEWAQFTKTPKEHSGSGPTTGACRVFVTASFSTTPPGTGFTATACFRFWKTCAVISGSAAIKASTASAGENSTIWPKAESLDDYCSVLSANRRDAQQRMQRRAATRRLHRR